MLKQHGLVEQVGDFDVLVTLEDAARSHELLLALGTGGPGETKHPYWTKHFYTYVIEGVEIDVMAGFAIDHEAGIYHFPFAADHVVARVQVGGEQVPLTALEDWYVLYDLMGRTAKAELLESHLRTQGLQHPQLLEKALQQSLPPALQQRVQEVLSKGAPV